MLQSWGQGCWNVTLAEVWGLPMLHSRELRVWKCLLHTFTTVCCFMIVLNRELAPIHLVLYYFSVPPVSFYLFPGMFFKRVGNAYRTAGKLPFSDIIIIAFISNFVQSWNSNNSPGFITLFQPPVSFKLFPGLFRDYGKELQNQMICWYFTVESK